MQALRGVLQQQASGFNPQTAIGWHSLFWAEGSDFIAQGYGDLADVTTWANETAETDATGYGVAPANAPKYVASTSGLNNKPSISFGYGANTRWFRQTFGTAPVYTAGVSWVIVTSWVGALNYMTWMNTETPNYQQLVYGGNGKFFSIYAGTTVLNGSSIPTNGAALLVAWFDGSTGADKLRVNGTLDLNANAGSGKANTDINIGGDNSGEKLPGNIALFGCYEGDITAHGQWSAFKTWAASHYSLTIA